MYPLLYLKYRLLPVRDHKNIRHLIIDEMQDYSYLQYVLLERMFSCNMTILGDRAQTVDEKQQDVMRFLPKIFGRHIRRIEIRKSYRNTLEIAAYAKRVSGVRDIEYLERHGREVQEIRYETLQEAVDEVIRQIRLGGDGYETAAILTMTEDQAREIYDILASREEVEVWEEKTNRSGAPKAAPGKIRTSYIDRDSSAFPRGLTVTTFYQAKGLEFDQVFVIGGDPANGFYRQFQYISATRALHELYVFHYKFFFL